VKRLQIKKKEEEGEVEREKFQQHKPSTAEPEVRMLLTSSAGTQE